MSLYLPPEFRVDELTALDALLAEHPFVTLLAISGDEPVVSHVPVLYQRNGHAIELRGHVSRANPQWRSVGTQLAIVHGPNAYVSPGWLPDHDDQARVPTWSYAVAHLRGQAHWFDDDSSLALLVDDMSRHFEPRSGGDWSYRHEREDLRVQLRGIIGFRLVVQDVQLKFKHQQNHPVRNQQAVADALSAIGGENNLAMAALMRGHLASLPENH